MATKQTTRSHLLEDIYATRDDEIYCDDAEIQMVLSTDALLSDEDSRRQYPALWHHFRFCADCEQSYRMLADLAQWEAAGELQPPARIPPRPTHPEATFWGTIKAKLQSAFPGFEPKMALGLARGGRMGEPVLINFDEGAIELEVAVERNDRHPEQRDLFCTVIPLDDEVAARLEGAPLWLQRQGDSAVFREAALDAMGDVDFQQIDPGIYTVRLFLNEQEYTVTELTLP